MSVRKTQEGLGWLLKNSEMDLLLRFPRGCSKQKIQVPTVSFEGGEKNHFIDIKSQQKQEEEKEICM